MKALTTAGLTKLIQLIKSSFIKTTDTVTTNTVTLATVATSGSYNDLSNQPTIGNGTITFTQGGVTKGTITTNQTGNSTIALDAGGGGGTVDQTYDGTSTNAQSGVAIAGAGFLQNTATGSYALTILGTAQTADKGTNVGYYTSAKLNSSAFGYYARATGQYAEVFGSNSTASGNWSITIGHSSTASGDYSIAIGSGASVSANRAIQLGIGANSTTNSLQIGFSASNNYILLDGTTGLIPDARISSDIARTMDIPTVPTNVSAFTNDSGYITGITSSNVTSALGYTPSDNTLSNVSSIDSSSAVQTALDGKADTDLSNLSATGETKIDNSILAILDTLYPVGSIYIGVMSTCPLETLDIGTWTLVSSGKVLQGADSTHTAGSTIAAGLPNITGSISSRPLSTQYSGAITGATGAFTYTRNGASGTTSPISTTATAVNTDTTQFHASNSNSIYGNSTTVQPPAYAVNIWERTA